MTVFKKLLNDYRYCLLQGDHMDASAAYLALIKENASMQSRLEDLEQEMQEQCRIIEMSNERELRMVSKMEQLDKEKSAYKNALAYVILYGSDSWSGRLIKEVYDALCSVTTISNKETNA